MSENNKIGETKYNTYGSKMKIVGYRKYNDIDVYFEEYNYTKTNVNYIQFKKGTIKCEYTPRICDVGYIGIGKYNAKDKSNKHNKYYEVWRDMIRRCYDPYIINKSLAYKDVIVCEEWHNFQNFAKWYEENYYEVDDEKMELDKDILIKGNKIYSPSTCIFAPQRINSLFIKHKYARTQLPIGVYHYKNTNKYISKYNNTPNNRKHLGIFRTVIDAFNAYKYAKESQLKDMAYEYKSKIPKRLYDAMITYEVEITD